MIYLISILYVILLHLNEKRQVFPDSERYISRKRLSLPFSLRWLLRDICRQNETLWNILAYGSALLIPIVSYHYFLSLGFSDELALIGGSLVCGLSGVILVNFAIKYLSDGFGMLMMVSALLAFNHGLDLLAVLFTVIGSMANEKTFVYTGLISLNPLALIGGIPILLRYFLYKHAEKDYINPDLISRPIRTSIMFHKGLWFSPVKMLLVWGVCLIALMNVDLHLGIVLLIAYGSMILATDNARLFMWAFPIVVSSALSVFPIEWAIPLVLAHWFNPYRLECV